MDHSPDDLTHFADLLRDDLLATTRNADPILVEDCVAWAIRLKVLLADPRACIVFNNIEWERAHDTASRGFHRAYNAICRGKRASDLMANPPRPPKPKPTRQSKPSPPKPIAQAPPAPKPALPHVVGHKVIGPPYTIGKGPPYSIGPVGVGANNSMYPKRPRKPPQPVRVVGRDEPAANPPFPRLAYSTLIRASPN